MCASGFGSAAQRDPEAAGGSGSRLRLFPAWLGLEGARRPMFNHSALALVEEEQLIRLSFLGLSMFLSDPALRPEHHLASLPLHSDRSDRLEGPPAHYL